MRILYLQPPETAVFAVFPGSGDDASRCSLMSVFWGLAVRNSVGVLELERHK